MTTMTNGMETDTSLTAFHCQSPINLRDYRILPRDVDCTTHDAEDAKYKPYSIVQKQTFSHADGFKCTKIVSQFTFICTSTLVAAHQRLAKIPSIELPVEVSRDDCHSLVTTEEYEGPDGQRHRVPLGKTTVLTFYEKGRQEVSGDSVVCQGEQVKLGDRVLDGVAILEQIKLTTETRKFRFEAATLGIQVKEEHRVLPCTAFYHYCVTSEGTYLWEELQRTQFQRVRHFTARTVQEEEQQTLISNQQKLRLMLGEQEKYDGRIYYLTKYQNIYVVEGDAEYLDPFPSDHLQLAAWIAARDDYITWSMEEKIMKAYRAISSNQCQRRKDILHTQLATSFTNPEGSHHIHLDHNKFGAIVGETLFTYQCQPVVVQPRAESRCTKELPVSLNGHKYFLEPVSRLLKRYGNPVPCSHLMPSKFLTSQGQWIAATPQLMVTAAPEEMIDIPEGGDFNLNHTDMTEGGLYTTQQVQEFTKLLNYPRAKTVVANTLYREACQENPNEVCTPFQEMLGPLGSQPTNFFTLRARIKTFLHDFGEPAAIFVAVYLIGAILKYVVDLVISCVTLRHVVGRRRWWQPLLPLKWIVSYDYGQASRAARKEQKQEQKERETEFRNLREQVNSEYEEQENVATEEQDKKLLDELEQDPGFSAA